MKKKVLAGILAATMAFSMAACGSTGSSSDSGSSAASGSTAKTEKKGEPYTVTMVLQGSQQQDEERIEEKINEILEPELNAKLDIVVLPWASASQQLQLMLSGDEKIDLLYTNATTAVQYMHSGQIMDMSELIAYILLYQMQSDPGSHRPILRIETVKQMRKVSGTDATSRIDNLYKDPISLFRQLYSHATSLRRKLKSVREKIEKYSLQ